MVRNNLEEQLAKRTFEYGNHTIIVTVRLKHHGYLGSSSIDYGESGAGYYRTVYVKAIPTEEYSTDESYSSIEADAYHHRHARVYPPSETEAVTVPDDPDLNIIKRVFVRFSDMTIDELKQQKRVKIRERKQSRNPDAESVEMSTQIEESVRPVLKTLDSQYQLLDEDVEIDIDVSIDRMSAEVSWTEVDDEMERISKELDNISEA